MPVSSMICNQSWRTAGRSGFLLGVAILCAACWQTVYLSPTIVGSYRSSTGAPRVGAAAVLSYSVADSACGKPAVRGMTDTAGRFRLDSTVARRKVMPIAERVTTYQVCLGVAGDSMALAYRQQTLSMRKRDSIECRLDASGERPSCVAAPPHGARLSVLQLAALAALVALVTIR